jgi:hypothetical protein
MAANGHGTSRIILVQRPRQARPPVLTAPPDEDIQRPQPIGAATARTGWTTRRLMVGASLGGIATLIGGILFKENFTLLTGSRGPILAVAFGLFVIGLIVFFGCLIGLVAVAVHTLATRHGWLATSLGLLTPGCLVFALWGAGAYGFMYPGLFTLLVAGGVVIALSR